ncbi:GMC family oxidoreductase [Streptomyces sp. AK02-01A]|uniref:GMC family oxidoreductase n=1 Tax=Streptomyces sp. AK02-01A TaxID=3028648 RepID=UPI0029A082C1|nr:GMC family oxidoreductase N-terminal domain-containing protein [Streptomyces sp. AK02-01A]MDX3853117.1 GMC family oxidoreductase N-terminal domain-containing protein [Streptomyces sp. AK02-01A]
MDSWDFVIVGGGTAGSVLASRLSEHPDAQVLLLEAGPADGPATMSVPSAWRGLMGSEVDWGFTTVPQAGLGGRTIPYPRGKVLGGSSSINAMMNVRGQRSAVDAWVTAGARGWGFDDLLPYYRRSEHTENLDTAYRGVEGPMRLEAAASSRPAAQAFLAAVQERGYPVSADLNGDVAEGVAWTELTTVDGVRQSAADAYLRPFLNRPNLTVVTDASVHTLTFSGTRCTGVRYVNDGSTHTAHARNEVLLCAGVIGSPQVLMLSGVGPVDALRAHGIDVVADLPGVGANLSDHPLGTIAYAAARQMPDGANNDVEVLGVLRTDPALAAPDVQILFMESPVVTPGTQGYRLGFSLLAPHSRGSVTLLSDEPGKAPAIDLGLLSDERDVAGMIAALRLAREISASKALDPWRGEEVSPGASVNSEDQLCSFLRSSVGTYFHAVGTCRMGTGASSVIDAELRVHGLDRLRVVDASVMPALPAANTNATVLAIAERAVDIITSRGR